MAKLVNVTLIVCVLLAAAAYVRQHVDSTPINLAQSIAPATGASRLVEWSPIRSVDLGLDIAEYAVGPIGGERASQFMREVLEGKPIASELMMVGDRFYLERYPELPWMRELEEGRPVRVGNIPLGDYEIQAGSVMFSLLRPSYDAIKASRRVCDVQEQPNPACEPARSLAVLRQIAMYSALEADESPARMAKRDSLVANGWNPRVYLPGTTPARELEMHLDGFARYYFAEWWEGEYRRILSARRLRLEVPALTRHAELYVALSNAVETLRAHVQADVDSLFTSGKQMRLSRIRAGHASDETKVSALIILLRALEAAEGA